MSLAQRNRLNAMRAVQAVAVPLFLDRGFDAVTVEDVAEEAEISPSTVYRHFGVKEELVLWEDLDGELAKAMTKHLGKGSPFKGLCAAYTEAYTLSSDAQSRLRNRAALIEATPDLRTYEVARMETQREELVGTLAKAYKRRASDLELDLIARVANAALLAAQVRWQAAGGRKTLSSWIKESFQAARAATKG
jgi:AcrR family transcriptional regulator